MRSIAAQVVSEAIERIILRAAFQLGACELAALERAAAAETQPRARAILETLIENARIAAAERLPLCQDCGSVVIWLERGDKVAITGGSLQQAADEAVQRAYRSGFLRPSMLRGALHRVNTGDNTPAMLRIESVAGDAMRVHVSLKGGGAENTSALRMLTPADGRGGVIDFVLDTVKRAGGRACPPLVVGVGVGGNFEGAAWLAKKALFRPLGAANADAELAAVENLLLERINRLEIGPMGLGGATTALAAHIEEAACHVASLPVAVNIECHSRRHGSIEL